MVLSGNFLLNRELKMKKSILFFFLLSVIVFAQHSTEKKSAQLILTGSFGYTIVDIPTAVDWPEAVGMGDGLTDWNNINYGGTIQVLFNLSKNIYIGPEAGISRIYFWERKYTPFGFSSRWEANGVGTWHIGGILKFQIDPSYYFFTGISFHTFLNDSGSTAGVPIAVGYEIYISDHLKVPIEFRTDIIFGDATPITIGGGLGLKFGL